VLIIAFLAADPQMRLRIYDVFNYPFFTNGFLPQALPTSCLTMAPKFNVQAVAGGRIGIGPKVLSFDIKLTLCKLYRNRSLMLDAKWHPLFWSLSLLLV
jgi:hypothetical protein